MMYGSFTHGTDPPHRPCSSGFLSLPNRLRRPPSPAHSAADCSVTRLSPRFRYYSAVRLLPGIASHFAFAYRVAYPGATRRPCQSSWGHASIFRTVPSANTLVRWVNENAFAPIVRARPCPTFGRPVHHRGSPHRLRPGTSPHALRIPPRGGHPALRRTARAVASGPPWLCPAFAFVPV